MTQLGEKPMENGRGRKPLLVPNDSYQRARITDVIRRASAELRQYDIDVPTDNFKLYTITVFYVEAAFKYLNTKYEKTKDYGVTLGGLIDIGLSVREISDAEKTGNINAVITIGDIGKALVENIRNELEIDPNIKKELLVPREDEEEDAKYIMAGAIKSLITYDMFFQPDDLRLYTAVMVFLKSAIITAIVEGVVSETHSAIINIGELFTINSSNTLINCVPGADGKLLVKSDGATEDE